MASRYLKMALAILLAWLPALFWLVFAATGMVFGIGGLMLIALGLGGIVGFIGLTIVCWTKKALTPLLTSFLACGVVSLSVMSGFCDAGRQLESHRSGNLAQDNLLCDLPPRLWGLQDLVLLQETSGGSLVNRGEFRGSNSFGKTRGTGPVLLD